MSSSDWNFPQPHAPHSSRHHAAQRGQRKSPLLLVLIILLLLALIATGIWWVFLRDESSSQGTEIGQGDCKGQITRLRLVTDDAVSSVVEGAATAVSKEGNGCDRFELVKSLSAQTATELASKPGQAPNFDVWIPASTGWIGRANPNPLQPNPYIPPQGKSVARSPLIVVMPNQQLANKATEVAAQVSKLPSAKDPKTWMPYLFAPSRPAQAGGVAFAIADPATTTAGMLSLPAITTAFSRGSTDPGISLMQTLHFKGMIGSGIKGIYPSTQPSMNELLGGLKDSKPVVFSALENDLWSFTQANPGVTVAAVYPSDAVAVADYPFLPVVGLDASRSDLARRLVEKLTSPSLNSAWTDHGLRPATGGDMPAAKSFQPQPVSSVGPMAVRVVPVEIGARVSDWVNYKQEPFNVLVLIDQSGSMATKNVLVNGKRISKADLLRLAGAQAAELFGSDTSLGIWAFGVPNDAVPYVPALSYGKMDEVMQDGKTRRTHSYEMISQFKAVPGTPTPLYKTTLEAIKFMKDKVEPGALTIVVPLTDGTDEVSKFSMGWEQYLQEYRQIADPRRPVVIFPVAFGADADINALQKMAKETLPDNLKQSMDTLSAAKKPTDLAQAIANVFLAVRAPALAQLRQAQAVAGPAAGH